MKIIQNLVPVSKHSIKCPNNMNAEFYVVHNTASDASARNEIKYMISNDKQTSYHYAIDDKEIIQGILESKNGWHAGDGNGSGNRKGIGIEICYSKSGGARFIQAEKNAVKFIAKGLSEKGWNIKDNIRKHQDFSGKYCPHRTLDMGWQRFLNMIQAELNKLNEVVKVDKNKPADWAKKDWEWAKKEGYLDGTRPLDNITRQEMAILIRRIVDKK